VSETEDYDKSATPTAHKTTHQDGGSDEISVAGLDGEPAQLTVHKDAADPHPGYRLESADHSHQTTGAGAGQLDHGLAITAASLLDDDHTQYAFLAGRAGGQTLIGGTAVADILKLQGTSGNGTLTSPAIQLLVGNAGATVGATVLNNGNVGIGTASPLSLLDVNGNIILSGSSRYMDFGSIAGSSGYGFRDNAGTIEFKSSGGSWAAIGAAGGGVDFATAAILGTL